MAKIEGLATKQHKIINLKQLARRSKVDYMRVYNNVKGNYNSLDDNEKTMLCNILHDELTALGQYLGFQVKIQRIK